MDVYFVSNSSDVFYVLSTDYLGVEIKVNTFSTDLSVTVPEERLALIENVQSASFLTPPNSDNVTSVLLELINSPSLFVVDSYSFDNATPTPFISFNESYTVFLGGYCGAYNPFGNKQFDF